MISRNIQYVTQRIARCCEKTGRRPEDVKLVCVTKTASVGEIEEALGAGLRIFGENRVQDAVLKHTAIGDIAEWHLIGHLQTNKAKDAVRIFSLIHSVDSARLAKAIDKEAGKIGKVQDILIQVNTSGQTSKFGIEPGLTETLINEIIVYPNIKVLGLMTIAPETGDPEEVRTYFGALRELRDEIALPSLAGRDDDKRSIDLRILSMGMTNDFEVAIEEGSNMVRIGRAIFSYRNA
jgi:hypothetical protein